MCDKEDFLSTFLGSSGRSNKLAWKQEKNKLKFINKD